MTNRIIAVLVGALLSLFIAVPASATDDFSVVSDCLTDWYVNPDEAGADPNQGDRRPTQTEDGLLFSGNMLVHHATNVPIGDLEPGTFVATPAPSLNSFFSVEVASDPANGNFSGYATLRWDGTQWNIGGTSFFDDDPAQLVADHAKGAVVFSFGVGYVNSPNNGTPTTVSSITFAGTTYDLTCEPEVPPTTQPASPSPPAVDPSESVEPSTSPSAAAATLPVTGPSVGSLILSGGIIVAVGFAIVLLSRRRSGEES